MPNESWVVANWEENFEIAQSRRRAGRLSWVAMPTRHDSRGYRRLIRGVNGVQHFAAWVVMVQVAARCHVRGILADDRGIGLSATDLENMTDIPSGVFESAFVALEDIGWITRCELVRDESDNAPSVLRLHNSTVQDKTEQDKTQQEDSSLELRVLKNSSQNMALASWVMIPENRRKGKGKWLENYAHIVEREQIDPEVVIDAVLRYYESPDGKSRYHRDAGTLIFDRVWDEDEQVWDRKNSTTIDGSDALDVFDRVSKKKGN